MSSPMPSLPGIKRAIDLSFPVRDHFRWSLETDLVHDLAKGDVFQTTRMQTLCHAFTHADAPLYVDASGMDIADMPLDAWMGPAAVLDLTSVPPNGAITAELLDAAGEHLQEGEIALLHTAWDERVEVTAEAFWTTSPYLTRDAAEWLAARKVRCVGYDFPQDYPIRGFVGEATPAGAADFVTHDVLLRNGIAMVEYLAGLSQINAARTFFVALPLRLEAIDGSPVRAIAIEFDTRSSR